MKNFKWMCLLTLAMSCAAQGASFDCAKAQSKVEKLICADADLSRLDEKMAVRYKEVLKISPQSDELRQTQRRWIRERNACPDTKCLSISYALRLRVIEVSVLAPFQFFRDETLPEQRTTPVCKEFRHYLNNPRSNELFNPDGTLVLESSLFKSVHWESLDKAEYRSAFISYLDVTRRWEAHDPNSVNNSIAHQLLRRYDSSQWILQRTLAYPFEFVPKSEQRQRWLYRLVNLQPKTRIRNDPKSKVEQPTWFNFGDEAFLAYEDGSQLENNRYGLVRSGVRQWITYAGNTYAVINATYDERDGATPAYLDLVVDQVMVDPNGQSYMSMRCAFRAKSSQ